MKLVKVKKPKGYSFTKMWFSNQKLAEKYVANLDKYFLLKKAQMLEYPLSKRKQKLVRLSKQKKHLLTRQGSKYLLWEEN